MILIKGAELDARQNGSDRLTWAWVPEMAKQLRSLILRRSRDPVPKAHVCLEPEWDEHFVRSVLRR
jgi:hypothetical protein